MSSADGPLVADEAGLMVPETSFLGQDRLYDLAGSPIHVPSLAVPSPIFPKALLKEQSTTEGNKDLPNDSGDLQSAAEEIRRATMPLDCMQAVSLSSNFTTDSQQLHHQIQALHKEIENLDGETSDGSSLSGSEATPARPQRDPELSTSSHHLTSFLQELEAKYKPATESNLTSADIAAQALQKSHALHQAQGRAGYDQAGEASLVTPRRGEEVPNQAVVSLLRQYGLGDLLSPARGGSLDGGTSEDGASLAGEPLTVLEGVLQQYSRQGRLLQELLASNHLSAEREQRVSSTLDHLRLEHEQAERQALDERRRKEREAAEALSASAKKAQRAESELQRLSHKLAELERSNRQKERELERLGRAVKAGAGSRQGQQREQAKTQEEVKRLEARASALRSQLALLEDLQRKKEKEMEDVVSQASRSAREAAESKASLQQAQAQMRKLESELSLQQRYVAELEQAARLKEQEIGQLVRSSAVAESERMAAQQSLEDTKQRLTSNIQRLKDQILQLEHASRAKDAEIQDWMENASVSSRGLDTAELEAERNRQEGARMATELQRLHHQLDSLHHSLREKEDKLAAAMSSASHCSLSVEEERRLNFKLREDVRRLEAESATLRLAVVQAEHAARAKEAGAEQLCAQLEAKVKAEERLHKRSSAAYARIKRALATSRGDMEGKSAAGAMAAACRELRPIEIVALYEEEREATEAEVAMLRAEVRTMAAQLREAENKALLLQAGKGTGRRFPDRGGGGLPGLRGREGRRGSAEGPHPCPTEMLLLLRGRRRVA
eukprot:jgi/Botrbrau1/15605/Bobra.0264s0005.1